MKIHRTSSGIERGMGKGSVNDVGGKAREKETTRKTKM
jgi:hypothetical protein